MPLFKNPDHGKEYKLNGYIVLPLLGTNKADSLNSLFNVHYSEMAVMSNNFYYSLMDENFERKISVANEINKLLIDEYDYYFTNISTHFQSFLSKPHQSSEMVLHQDWSHTDERLHDIATSWCPLQSTTIENGTVYAIKGSHTFFKNYRSESYPTSRISINEELYKFITPIPVPKGHILFFHPALWHGSYSNITDDMRTVATSIIVPLNTPINYYHKFDKTTSQCFQMEQKYLFSQLKNLAEGQKPLDHISCYNFPYVHNLISFADILSILKLRLK